MQILRSQPRPAEAELCGWVPESVLLRSPGDSDVWSRQFDPHSCVCIHSAHTLVPIYPIVNCYISLPYPLLRASAHAAPSLGTPFTSSQCLNPFLLQDPAQTSFLWTNPKIPLTGTFLPPGCFKR